MARLLEVAGALEQGSITLIGTVINDGDDRDPVSEAARSLLDGHIVLSQRLAEAGRFPAVDVPASSSRTMDAVADAAHACAARRVRRSLALLARVDDARTLGIEPGDRAARVAIAAQPALDLFLCQGRDGSAPDATLTALAALAALLDDDGDS
jgi:flagellar biosynthesis/type III secretory pathway ATPase